MKAARYVIPVALQLATAGFACTQANPAYCLSDVECTHPGYPFCNVAIHACVNDLGGDGGTQDGDQHAPTTVYVDSSVCPGEGSGTAEDPFCRLADALNAGGTVGTIRVGAGTYVEDPISISRDLQLQGEDSPVIEIASGCPGILILNGARVTIRGFEIRGSGGIRVTSLAEAAILDNTIASDGCIGVDCNGATCQIARNTIRANPLGGVSLSSTTFTVVNNFVVSNGTFGGVQINQAPAGSSFVNNTVADNAGRGVLCQVPLAVRNSILWQNRDGDLGGSCTATNSDAGGQIPGEDNFSQDPLFVDGYHIDANSPCVGRADPAYAPADDVDGEPRDSEPDVGADEAGGD